jgi:hypothetical protein
MKQNSLTNLLREIHEDENGSLSLETILIIGAIALPILIFLIVKAWPTIKEYFNTGLENLQNDSSNAQN